MIKPGWRTKPILTTMKNPLLMALACAATFGLGFASKTVTTEQTNDQATMKKVTGIGGVFFKCKDPKKMNAWYNMHLGLDAGQYGASFEWREEADPTKKGVTQWSTFAENTTYFEPSTKDFMINYRVENLEGLVEQLKKEGVTIIDEIEASEYGKFVHILDAEGNKVELWEPGASE